MSVYCIDVSLLDISLTSYTMSERKLVDLGSGSNETAPHYSDVIMSTMTSQITSVLIVYAAVCSGVDQRKHQSTASLAFVMGIHR